LASGVTNPVSDRAAALLGAGLHLRRCDPGDLAAHVAHDLALEARARLGRELLEELLRLLRHVPAAIDVVRVQPRDLVAPQRQHRL
jgi:hypothetical protein